MPTLHGLAPGDYGAASRVLRLIGGRVIACAPSVARSLQEAGFPGDRIDVITNGAALQPAGPQRQAELRVALGLGPGPVVVGIGRLVTQKNWPAFIEAAGHLPGPSYVVAGEGPLRQELVDLATASGGRVRFVGLVDDVAALVGLASCVVSTSSWEGLPLTLLEALSLGAPVVATAVDGVTDVVPPNRRPAGEPGRSAGGRRSHLARPGRRWPGMRTAAGGPGRSPELGTGADARQVPAGLPGCVYRRTALVLGLRADSTLPIRSTVPITRAPEDVRSCTVAPTCFQVSAPEWTTSTTPSVAPATRIASASSAREGPATMTSSAREVSRGSWSR